MLGLLGAALVGSSADDEDSQEDAPSNGDEQGDPTPVIEIFDAASVDAHPFFKRTTARATVTGTDGADLLAALDAVPDGGDTICGKAGNDGGDEVTSGDGGDKTYVPLDPRPDGPVVIKDFDFTAGREHAEADHLILTNPDGSVIPREAFFDGSLAIGTAICPTEQRPADRDPRRAGGAGPVLPHLVARRLPAAPPGEDRRR